MHTAPQELIEKTLTSFVEAAQKCVDTGTEKYKALVSGLSDTHSRVFMQIKGNHGVPISILEEEHPVRFLHMLEKNVGQDGFLYPDEQQNFDYLRQLEDKIRQLRRLFGNVLETESFDQTAGFVKKIQAPAVKSPPIMVPKQTTERHTEQQGDIDKDISELKTKLGVKGIMDPETMSAYTKGLRWANWIVSLSAVRNLNIRKHAFKIAEMTQNMLLFFKLLLGFVNSPAESPKVDDIICDSDPLEILEEIKKLLRVYKIETPNLRSRYGFRSARINNIRASEEVMFKHCHITETDPQRPYYQLLWMIYRGSLFDFIEAVIHECETQETDEASKELRKLYRSVLRIFSKSLEKNSV